MRVFGSSQLPGFSLFFLSILLIYLTLSFSLHTSLYIPHSLYPSLCSLLFSSPVYLLIHSCPLIFPSVTVNSACFNQPQYFQDSPSSLLLHSPSRFLACEGVQALLSGDRSPFFAPTEKINTPSPAIDSLQYRQQSRTTGALERQNEGSK